MRLASGVPRTLGFEGVGLFICANGAGLQARLKLRARPRRHNNRDDFAHLMRPAPVL